MAQNLIRGKQINQSDLTGVVQNVIDANEFSLNYNGGTGFNIDSVASINISGTTLNIYDTPVNITDDFNLSGLGYFSNALNLNNIDSVVFSGVDINVIGGTVTADNIIYNTGTQTVSGNVVVASGIYAEAVYAKNLVYNTGDQTISGIKRFDSLRIEPSRTAFTVGTGLNINSESGIVRVNTNVSSSFGAGFTYALTTGMDPNRPLDIEGRGRLVHGLSLDAGSDNFTSASDHFHFFFSAGPANPGSFNGKYSTDTNTNYKSYQFSPTTRPNGNDNQRDLIHLTTLEAKGANDEAFPTTSLTELYLTTTGTVVVTPPGTGLVQLAYAVNGQSTSQYLHATGDTVYLRIFPGIAGLVANTYNGTVVTRATGYEAGYGSTNIYKVGIAFGALGFNNNFNPAQKGTSTQTDAWALSRNTTSSAFTGIKRIERNSSQYLDQFNVFYTSPITGYTGESVVVDVFNRGAGTFIASGITLTQGRYDGYVSKVLSTTGLEITLSIMNYGSLGGVGRPGNFQNPNLTTGISAISSEDLITGMQIFRGASDAVHRQYWAHNIFAGFRNIDANDLNVPAGVITRVAIGGLNRVESGSTSALGYNNQAYNFNSHAYGANQENYNRDSVRIGPTSGSYINIVSGRVGINTQYPTQTLDIAGNLNASSGTFSNGLQVSGTGTFNALDLNNIDVLSLSGVDITITSGNVILTNPLNAPNIVYNTGNQNISGVKTFINSGIFSNGGVPAVPLLNNPLSIVGSGTGYIQVNIQNRSTGLTATADLVITANNGTDNSNYINLGINNSGYNDPTFSNGSGLDGYLFINGGSLDIGTATPNTQIEFHAGGTTAANTIARISQSGLNLVSGNLTVNNTGVLLTGQNSFIIPISTSQSNFSNANTIYYFNGIGAGYSTTRSNRTMPILEPCVVKKVSFTLQNDVAATPAANVTGFFINATKNLTGIIFTGVTTVADGNFYTYTSGNLNIPFAEGDSVVCGIFTTTASSTSIRSMVNAYCYN